MARRRREVADAGPSARTAAHEAYGKAIRTGHDLRLEHPATVAAHGARLIGNGASSGGRRSKPANDHVGHPGFAESLIPVWGSGCEAIADYQDGDYAGAALNGALALSDLSVEGVAANSIRKAAEKGGLKGAMFVVKGAVGDSAKATAWKSVRKKMGDFGQLKKFQHGHHWLIPQRWTGVPEFVRNHPLNIKGMQSQKIHGRVHGRYAGQPQYGLLGQYWHGTPHWSKAVTGSAVGHSVATETAGEVHR